MEPISRIDPENGVLYYRGTSVSELIGNSSFESVLFLLIHGREGNLSETNLMADRLIEARCYFMENLDRMQDVRRDNGHSMLVIFADELDSIKQDYDLDQYSTLLAIVSCAPLAVAFEYHLANRTDPVPPNSRLHHSANLLWMLRADVQSQEEISDFEACLILHMDDPENPSLAALESSLDASSSLASAFSTALSEHSGPLHHGAGTEAALMLDEFWQANNPSLKVKERLDAGLKIFGLGHRIYKTYDPRARILREMLLRRHESGSRYVTFIDRIAEEGARQLHARKGLNAYPNVDLFNAITYETFGLPSGLNTALFAVSRMAGWMAHAWEKLQSFS